MGCAVLGTKDLLVGAVDEIQLSKGFFDYTEKYTLKSSKIHVPAHISPEKAEEIKKTALTIYRLLNCSFFARVDMFLTPTGEDVSMGKGRAWIELNIDNLTHNVKQF